ncbi:MAG: hypothetical protein B6241_08035 [Spirochaetaceae bacterium 4572_59]|nr:MAG: hypothetical protein B6241_08035 [Spirochaetaceae bacterium 4572_59]
MQNIRRSLMIFHLKEDYSNGDLQRAFKKLIKKYHPDFNQDKQDWSHKKMTEINLAYEQCKKYLIIKNKRKETDAPEGQSQSMVHTQYEFYRSAQRDPFHTQQAEAEQRRQQDHSRETLSDDLYKNIREITMRFNRATGRYYEYGLENRYLRHEGTRRIRYRQSIRELQEVVKSLDKLRSLCHKEYDHYIQELYRDFIMDFYEYMTLDETDIPRHPKINSHWHKMEEYLNASLMDYLASYMTNRFNKINWKVTFTHSVTFINYLKRRFPKLREDSSFKKIVRLAESYAEIRREEEKNGIRFFFP